MNLAIGMWFLWVGAALLYLASHGLAAATPWGAFTSVLGKMRGETAEEA